MLGEETRVLNLGEETTIFTLWTRGLGAHDCGIDGLEIHKKGGERRG